MGHEKQAYEDLSLPIRKNLARSRFQEKDRKLMVQQLSIIPKLPIQEENT